MKSHKWPHRLNFLPVLAGMLSSFLWSTFTAGLVRMQGRALFAYAARDKTEISFSLGDTLFITNIGEDGWSLLRFLLV